MGQHPSARPAPFRVIAAMHEAHRTAAAPVPAARATSPAPTTTTSCSSASSPTCTARKRAALHLGLRLQLGALWHARRAGSRLRRPVGRAEPRLDDRGHPPQSGRDAVFAHNDPEDLARKLRDIDPSRPKLIAFESVYSMDGDIAPIAEICDVAEAYGAMTYLDEVHAVGLYGPRGGGIAERDGLMATGSPSSRARWARPSASSAATSPASAALCDFVRSFASGFIFTTALPPANRRRRGGQHPPPEGSSIERERPAGARRQACAGRLDAAACRTCGTQPHRAGDGGRPGLCKLISDRLLDQYGIYVQPINYPTVPRGTERLRITPSPLR
jgi:hypothetical protein